MRTKLVVILMAFVVFGNSDVTALDIKRYVKQGGTGNGTSWENACGSIQKAVDDCALAGSGSVYIAAGTFKEKVTVPSKSKSIKMYGGFPSNGGEKQDYKNNRTIIDGTGRSHCILVDFWVEDIVIDGIECHNGMRGTVPFRELKTNMASGIVVMNGGTTISNCYVYNCHDWGIELHDTGLIEDCIIKGCDGGVYMRGGTCRRCDIDGNGESGGVFLTTYSSSPGVVNCIVRNNAGPGITAYSGQVYFCNIYNNSTEKNGGGLNLRGGIISIYGCCIYNNTAHKGGGIYSATGENVLESSTIVNNSASEGGAGIHYENTDYKIAGIILWNNKTEGKDSQFRFEKCGIKSSLMYSAITGGGLLPETDAENGIIDISTVNTDSAKPAIRFKKVSSVAGKLKTDAALSNDFELLPGSAAIGKGGKVGRYKWIDNSSFYDRGINGEKGDINHFNCGAYQDTTSLQSKEPVKNVENEAEVIVQTSIHEKQKLKVSCSYPDLKADVKEYQYQDGVLTILLELEYVGQDAPLICTGSYCTLPSGKRQKAVAKFEGRRMKSGDKAEIPVTVTQLQGYDVLPSLVISLLMDRAGYIHISDIVL